MLILNKILPLLVLPPGIYLVLIVAGLVWRRKVLAWTGVLLLFLLSLPLVSGPLMRAVEWPYKRVSLRDVRSADAIVVLSGMIEHTPGAPLGEWNDAADRFEGGVELFKSGKSQLLVFTFGQVPWAVHDVTEGQLLARRARLLGVSEKAIRVTGFGGNTSEESVAVAQMLGGDRVHKKRIILVTSAFHMRRAEQLFRRAGFAVYPYPVDFRSTANSSITVLDFLPNAESMASSSQALREMIGVGFYLAKFQLENLGILKAGR